MGGISQPSVFLDLGQRLAVHAGSAVGRASRTADADLDAAMLAVTEVIFFEQQQVSRSSLISLRSRSRVRSSRANSSSCAARSTGSGKLAASSFMWSTVRSTSISWLRQAPRDLTKTPLLVIHVLPLTGFHLVRLYTRNGQGPRDFLFSPVGMPCLLIQHATRAIHKLRATSIAEGQRRQTSLYRNVTHFCIYSLPRQHMVRWRDKILSHHALHPNMGAIA